MEGLLQGLSVKRKYTEYNGMESRFYIVASTLKTLNDELYSSSLK